MTLLKCENSLASITFLKNLRENISEIKVLLYYKSLFSITCFNADYNSQGYSRVRRLRPTRASPFPRDW